MNRENSELTSPAVEETNDSTKPPNDSSKSTLAGRWKVDFILLCVMLVLALVGLGVTQASETGAWEYWLIAVLTFAGIGVYRDVSNAKRKDQPIWKSIGKQVCHWLGLLIVMKALILMERTDAISRESASIASLILLALTCYLAGLHFHWTFMIVGIVLAVMAVVIATLEQYMLMMWLIMVPIAIGGAFLFYVRGKKMAKSSRVC